MAEGRDNAVPGGGTPWRLLKLTLPVFNARFVTKQSYQKLGRASASASTLPDKSPRRLMARKSQVSAISADQQKNQTRPAKWEQIMSKKYLGTADANGTKILTTNEAFIAYTVIFCKFYTMLALKLLIVAVS